LGHRALSKSSAASSAPSSAPAPVVVTPVPPSPVRCGTHEWAPFRAAVVAYCARARAVGPKYCPELLEAFACTCADDPPPPIPHEATLGEAFEYSITAAIDDRALPLYSVRFARDDGHWVVRAAAFNECVACWPGQWVDF